MTQLILANNIYLPETSRGKYKCYPAQLGEQVDMISGRRVLEVRGQVQMIEYEYDYMGNELMRQVNSVLRSGQSFTVAYLPDGGDSLVVSTFLTESFPQPTFAFSRGGKPYWHNVAFTLREVQPHD